MAVQRNISITVNGSLPINGYKGLIQRVNEFEHRIANGETVDAIDPVASDPAMRIVVTGLTYSEVYQFDISELNPATGVYVIDFVQAGL